MLHRCGTERSADSSQQHHALVARVGEHADLDQLVRGEIDVDFPKHRRREPVVTDADDRVQVMCLGAQRPSLRR